MTLVDMISGGSVKYPDRIALKFKERTWTYKDLDEQTNKIANGLKKLGVNKGDRVGLLMINSPYFVLSYFAIVKLGAVVVPANVMFKGEELAYQLNDSDVSILITSGHFLPVVKEIREQLTYIRHIIVAGDKNEIVSATLEEMLENETNELVLGYTVSSEDLAVFLYTSGTTGRPKAAMLTHDNIVSNAAATQEATASTETDTTLCVLPLFHSFAWTACVALPFYYGGRVILFESFVPQLVLKAIVEEQVTIFAGVPTMYSVLLQVPEVNPDEYTHLRLCYSGGAACPMEVLDKFKAKYGISIFEGYGLSECSPVCTTNPYYGERKPGSIGMPIPGVECRVIDDEGNEVPRNTPGELLFKGPNVMKGYYKKPEATEEALKEGWMHTGDIGYMDEEGYIFIIDRKKDMIIVSGLNVYPREIEEILYAYPKVAEAAVVGAPDALRGEYVKAFVALKEGETASEREIVKFLQAKLANYKLPKKIEFLDALPRNGSGKILKNDLKNQFK